MIIQERFQDQRSSADLKQIVNQADGLDNTQILYPTAYQDWCIATSNHSISGVVHHL